MKTALVQCYECSDWFYRDSREVRRSEKLNRRSFCSRKCFGKFCSRNNKINHEPNTECAQCGRKFYRSDSRLKNSKSGLFFCSRECKDKAQRLGGIQEIHPSHYGTGKYAKSYRKTAFRNYPKKCNQCGWNKVPKVLQVHHIDGDRENNNVDNLQILCPTCHAIVHLRWR